MADSFHAAHEALYGYADSGRTIEHVTARVRAEVATPRVELPKPKRRTRQPKTRRIHVGGKWQEIPVYQRSELPKKLAGPALIVDYGSTTLVPAKWSVSMDEVGNVLLDSSGHEMP